MRYDFYRKVAKILAKNNEDMLFDYIIHCMDDNGFLRSRWCYWADKTLENYKGCDNTNTVLVTLNHPFDFEKETEYYVKDDFTNTNYLLPRFKMQLFFEDLSDEDKFMEEVNWSSGVGFPYPIKIDMINETYEILERVDFW